MKHFILRFVMAVVLYCIALTILFITFAPFCGAQEHSATFLSPSLSIRDAKLSNDLPYDYQLAITFWRIGSNYFYTEFERENDVFYRNREFRMQMLGLYFQDKQYTSRNIWTTEFGYVYQYKDSPLKAGASLVFDNWGRSNKVAVVEYSDRIFFIRWLKGQSKWVFDSNMVMGAPFRKELFKLGNLSFQPGWELLFKWYQDEHSKFRQFKIGFVIHFKY